VGVVLFYHDTWFPPFARLLEQRDIWNFSPDYLIELVGRLINWNYVGAALVLIVAYLFVSQWLRLTTITVAVLACMAIGGLPMPSFLIAPPAVVAGSAPPAGPAATSAQPAAAQQAAGPPNNATLDAYLDAFHKSEAQRSVQIPPLPADAEPFDMLIMNVCSMSWADLETVGLRDHPVFGQMDVIFDDFNSATSYSGPAAIRLLRATCGQESHTALYDSIPEQCYLFENLNKLGFISEMALNHDGQFQSYLSRVRTQGKLPPPVPQPDPSQRALTGFDGGPIWRDLDVLQTWWKQRQQLDSPRIVTFYNTITLHDGNRLPGGKGTADYKLRAQHLLDDISTFIGQVERSGRRVLLVIAPEHGASLHGDRMQIAGMREIPSPSITHVPVGLKLINAKARREGGPVHVTTPSS